VNDILTFVIANFITQFVPWFVAWFLDMSSSPEVCT